MKKIRVCALALAALVVTFNVYTRTGGPVIHWEILFPASAAVKPLTSLSSRVLLPGAPALWYLGSDFDTGGELFAAALLSWWLWLSCLRLVWCILGRAFGVANMADYHLWLRFSLLPWRWPYRWWLRLKCWWKQFRYGPDATASWTGVLSTMTNVFRRADSIYLGRLWAYGVGFFQTIGIRGPRHVNVIAAPGSGKTRWLMAWLGMLHKEASAFAVDCDGQIVNALGAALERAGHLIVNLDPYGLSHFPGASWNAVAELTRCAERHGRQAVVRFAQTLAEALIREENSNQPVFANSARNFMHGLILYVWLFEEDVLCNLVRVRDLLTRGLPEYATEENKDGFQALLTRMTRAPALIDDRCGGEIATVIARAASVMQSGQRAKEGNPFRSTAISQTSWLDLPEIAAISGRSDFACEDLKTGNPCVFLCAPVTDIQTKLSGWVRALTMMTAYAFQNMPNDRRGRIPCLLLIDEAPSLGRVEMFETASAVFRHFGLRLVMLMQDLGQLKSVYPHYWETFIGNAEANIWMGTSHQFTLEYLSKTLGTTTETVTVKGGALSDAPARLDKRECPLLRPQQAFEFLSRARGQILVTRADGPPMRIAYDGYDTALPVTAYEADENYKERRLRALTRRALAWLWVRRPPRGGGGSEARNERRRRVRKMEISSAFNASANAAPDGATMSESISGEGLRGSRTLPDAANAGPEGVDPEAVRRNEAQDRRLAHKARISDQNLRDRWRLEGDLDRRYGQDIRQLRAEIDELQNTLNSSGPVRLLWLKLTRQISRDPGRDLNLLQSTKEMYEGYQAEARQAFEERLRNEEQSRQSEELRAAFNAQQNPETAESSSRAPLSKQQAAERMESLENSRAKPAAEPHLRPGGKTEELVHADVAVRHEAEISRLKAFLSSDGADHDPLGNLEPSADQDLGSGFELPF